MTTAKFDPVERKMFDVLSDGRVHTLLELRGCLWDELSQNSAVYQHISNIRKKIAPNGLGVLQVGKNGNTAYRLVRFLADD